MTAATEFTIDTGKGVLTWTRGRFSGDPNLVEIAQQFVVKGLRVPIMLTPSVVCGNRPVRRAWATAVGVCDFIGARPDIAVPEGVFAPGDLAVPKGAIT